MAEAQGHWVAAPWWSHLKYGHIIGGVLNGDPCHSDSFAHEVRVVDRLVAPLSQLACEADLDLDSEDKYSFYCDLMRWGKTEKLLTGIEHDRVMHFLATFELG